MGDSGELRSIEDDEILLMLQWRNAPAVRANMYSTHVISRQEHEQWWNKVKIDPTKRYFMFDLSRQPTGIVAFTAIDRKNCNAFWAFYAAPNAPKGVGKKMEFLALEYAFTELKLHKLCCEVLSFNVGVIELHKKYGFVVEGIFRQQHWIDGSFVDTYRLGILREEWADIRATVMSRTKPSG